LAGPGIFDLPDTKWYRLTGFLSVETGFYPVKTGFYPVKTGFYPVKTG